MRHCGQGRSAVSDAEVRRSDRNPVVGDEVPGQGLGILRKMKWVSGGSFGPDVV